MSLLSKFLNTKNIYSKRKLQNKVSLQIILGKNVDKTKILKASSPFTPSPPNVHWTFCVKESICVRPLTRVAGRAKNVVKPTPNQIHTYTDW